MAKKTKTTVTRKEFSDLYILSALSNVIETEHRNDLIQYRNRLIYDIANYYIPNVHNALVNEACHHGERRYPKYDELKKHELEKRLGLTEEKYKELFIKNNASTSDWDKMNDYIKNLSNQGLSDIFRYCDWSPAFGGEAWANIADLHLQLVGWRNVLAKEYYNNTHHLIADHINGEFYNKLHNMMTVIDRLHQAEHNTGSIFTKFGDMTTWLHLALNEKAIRNSIQLLKTYASSTIVKAIGSLNAENVSEAEIEAQLGETIISRTRTKYLKKCYYNMNSSIDQKKHLLDKGQITVEEFEKKKQKYIKQYDEACAESISSSAVAEAIRDLYYSKAYREARGIMRCIFQENNKSTINDCLSTILDLCIKDKESVGLACQNEMVKEHVLNHFLSTLDYYNYFHSGYKNIYDFIYENYNSLVESKKLNSQRAKNIYKRLIEGKYDVSKLIKPTGIIEKPKHIPSVAEMAAKHPSIAATNAKDFATAYAGKKIKATHAYAGEIAAFNNDSWAFDTHLGKIIGYAGTKIVYNPSSIMKSKGYPGVSPKSISGAVYTIDSMNMPSTAYMAELGNVELVNPPPPAVVAPYGLKKDGTPKKKPGKKSKAEIEAKNKANQTLNDWKDWNVYCTGNSKSEEIKKIAKQNNMPVVVLPLDASGSMAAIKGKIEKAFGTNPCAEQPLDAGKHISVTYNVDEKGKKKTVEFFDDVHYFHQAIMKAFNLPAEMVIKNPEDDIITKK